MSTPVVSRFESAVLVGVTAVGAAVVAVPASVPDLSDAVVVAARLAPFLVAVEAVVLLDAFLGRKDKAHS